MNLADEIIYLGFLYGHGGDALQMLDLATGMQARGRRVKIVVPELDTTLDFADRCKQRAIPVIREPLIFTGNIPNIHSLRDQVALLRKYRAPILHLHTGNVCLPRTTLLAMSLLRLPRSFVTVHSPIDNMHGDRMRMRIWASAVSRKMHCVICPSENGRRLQLSYGVDPKRVLRIYNSIDTRRFSQGCAENAREYLHLPPEARMIVFCSRLDPQKRPQEALEIFHRVAGQIEDTHMIFVGRGTQETELRRIAAANPYAQRVHFVGYQGNVPDWLAAADLWLFPTETENFSLSVLEALSAGCPIVSTHCQGNDEVLVNEGNALTTAVGDVDSMTAAVLRILRDPELALRLRRQAQETSRHYTIDRMVEEYRECYHQASL